MVVLKERAANRQLFCFDGQWIGPIGRIGPITPLTTDQPQNPIYYSSFNL